LRASTLGRAGDRRRNVRREEDFSRSDARFYTQTALAQPIPDSALNRWSDCTWHARQVPARTDEELLLCRQVRGLSKAETLDRYRADPGGYPCDRAVVERNAAWRARVRPSSMTAAFRSKNALNRTSVYRSASGVRSPASRPLRRSQKVIRGPRERNASASERAALVLGAAV